MEEKCKKEEQLRSELEVQTKKLEDERNELFMQLQAERDTMSDVYDRSDRLNAAKADLEKQIAVRRHSPDSNLFLCQYR